MNTESPANDRRAIRILAGGAMAVFIMLVGRPAPAYFVATENGIPLAWTSESPGTIWNNSSQTLFWSFDPIGFPQSTWPTVAQAGAAFQNAFQTLQDVAGTNLKVIRNPDSSGTPTSGDGQFQASLTASASSDYFRQNISGEAAVTYISFDVATGALLDADIEVNGAFGTWTTTNLSPPNGTFDLESVALGQAMTALGASTTPYFSAAAWPLLRSPLDVTHDRCVSPDDRMYLRTIAPASPAFSTVTGTVTVNGTGSAVNQAIVVATDADGVPQAITVTHPDGTYTLNIPSSTNDATPLTDYTLAAFHYLNGTYAAPTNHDLSFTSPTGFIAVQPPASPVNTRSLSPQNFTVTSGTPTLTLEQLSLSPNPLGTQALFLDSNTMGATNSGTLQFSFQGSFTSVSNLNLGSGINIVGSPTVTNPQSTTTLVMVGYNVTSGSPPGPRNLSFTIPSGEQFFLPAMLEVVSQGGITVQAGPQDPGAQNASDGQLGVSLLQVTLSASTVEDVRIHQLLFSIAGQGSAPQAVRLYNDVGSVPGFQDPGDVPIHTGGAYSQNPVGETIVPSGASATLTFDNLALTIPAGTSLTLLLVADMAPAGSGSYTATLDPTTPGNVVSQGMFWGDALTPGGSAVSGGLLTMGAVSILGLGQFHTADSSLIPVGGFTTETQVTIQGTVSAPTGQVGMEVEAKPLGIPFDGTNTQVQAATAANGSVVSLTYTGLVSGTSYHWRARGLCSSGQDSGWVPFGNNSESAADFSVDQSTVSVPTGLGQFSLSGAAVPPGGSSQSGISLVAQGGTDSLGYPVRVEFEVRTRFGAFQNVATSVGSFGPGGAVESVAERGNSGAFHWQVRTLSQFGASSAWVPFGVTGTDFTLEPPPPSSSKGGCVASVEPESGAGGRIAWILGVAVLLVLLPGRWKKPASLLSILVALGSVAQANEDPPLPRSLFEVPAPGASLAEELPASIEVPELADPVAQDKPMPVTYWSFDAYAGAQLLNTRFSAVGSDHATRNLRGIGAPLVGLEGLYDVKNDWWVGLGGQVSLWRDVRILSVGPVVAYRFMHSAETSMSGRYTWEHFIRAQISYESFVDTQPGFNNFIGTLGGALGYELRWTLVRHYSLTFGADLEFAQWNASAGILSGDKKVGGLGGFFYVGIALLP